jgi:hypothetical protein
MPVPAQPRIEPGDPVVFFEWNGVNLDQFMTKVDGPQLLSSGVVVNSWLGLNWIEITATSLAGGGTGADTAVALPIKVTPPSKNYIIEADAICIVSPSNARGPFVAARHNGADNSVGYWLRYASSNSGSRNRLDKLGGTPGAPTVSNLITSDEIDLSALYMGRPLRLRVEGDSVLSMTEEDFLYADQATPHTNVGYGAIGVSTNGVGSVTQTNIFRRIRMLKAD